MNDLVPLPPRHDEFEAMPLAERVALEPALEKLEALFGEAYDDLRRLNDHEITMLAEGGASLRTIADLAGVTHRAIEKRLDRLGVETVGQREVSTGRHPLPQNGDSPAEEVSGEVVDDPNDRPAHHLPDVVAEDADQNLRTTAVRWFEWGRTVEGLLDKEAVVEPKDRADKAAIKREATQMAAIARRLKGAF